jgi:DNA-binding transcriptional MerR regulator
VPIARFTPRDLEYLRDRAERGGTHGVPMSDLRQLLDGYDAAVQLEDQITHLRDRIRDAHAQACRGDSYLCQACVVVDALTKLLEGKGGRA